MTGYVYKGLLYDHLFKGPVAWGPGVTFPLVMSQQQLSEKFETFSLSDVAYLVQKEFEITTAASTRYIELSTHGIYSPRLQLSTMRTAPV